ncbi:hypothetical protein MASR2M15_03550 [Anaerolineales bacterium]
MAIEHKEEERVINTRQGVQRERIVEHTPSGRSVFVSRVTRFLWFLIAVIVGLIAIRLFLGLIAANPQNDFVRAIVGFTDIFVAPFIGIVGAPGIGDGGSYLDTAALFAMAVYLLGGWALISLFRIVFASSRSSRQISTKETFNERL